MSAAILGFALFLAGVAAGLAQLWLHVWSDETFAKLLISDGALIAVLIVWRFIARERRDEEQIRDDNQLR